MSTQDIKKIILNNQHSHLVCLTPITENKRELLQSLLLSGLSCQGSSFKLENGTRVTVASIDSEIPPEGFHLAYYNWTAKKGITIKQKNRIKEWEKQAGQIVNLFE